jgi:hypothetical protein
VAVSSSTDFKSVGTELVAGALSRLGVLAEEEPLQAFELARGLRYLTQMLKTWQADGLSGWLHTRDTLALVSADADYVFGSGGSFATVVFDIVSVEVSNNGNPYVPLRKISRAEYYRKPVRTTSGQPTEFFFDRQRDNGTLYLWPVPDTDDFDITFTYRRRIMDMDLGAENADLPPEWEEAIEYGLAERLAFPYGIINSNPTLYAAVKSEAARTYAIVKAFDVEQDGGEISILPDYDYFEARA